MMFPLKAIYDHSWYRLYEYAWTNGAVLPSGGSVAHPRKLRGRNLWHPTEMIIHVHWLTCSWAMWIANPCWCSLMPSSHLPRTLCDKFVYDFPCDFWGIVGGYGLQRMCSHCLRASCDFFYGASGATRGKSVQRLCGDCTEIVECHCNCRAVSAASARSPCGDRPSHGTRAEIVQCHLQHVYGLLAYDLFKFVNLLAKPNRRGHGARESIQKSHSRLLPPQGGLAEAARKGGYGQDTSSVDPSQAKCELGIRYPQFN